MNRGRKIAVFVILLSAFAVSVCIEKDAPETMEGTFIDCGEWGFLVQGASDGEPYVFSYAMGTDVSRFKEGDHIIVEYIIEKDKIAEDSRINISDHVALSVEHAEANES